MSGAPLRPNLRTDALGRALRRAAERECERHAPGLRDAVLAEIAAPPEAVRSSPRRAWRVAASVAALFAVAALALIAQRAARGELGRRATRGTGRDPELAVPRVAPLHEALVAQAAPRVPGAGRTTPRERDFLARTLPESRALDIALRGEIAGLGRDTLAGARFLFERARLGPPQRGS